jgi:hypothetical protein
VFLSPCALRWLTASGSSGTVADSHISARAEGLVPGALAFLQSEASKELQLRGLLLSVTWTECILAIWDRHLGLEASIPSKAVVLFLLRVRSQFCAWDRRECYSATASHDAEGRAHICNMNVAQYLHSPNNSYSVTVVIEC